MKQGEYSEAVVYSPFRDKNNNVFPSDIKTIKIKPANEFIYYVLSSSASDTPLVYDMHADAEDYNELFQNIKCDIGELAKLCAPEERSKILDNTKYKLFMKTEDTKTKEEN
jgi:hypothetical protein